MHLKRLSWRRHLPMLSHRGLHLDGWSCEHGQKARRKSTSFFFVVFFSMINIDKPFFQ
jgi:hypothetical protein